MLIAVFPSAPAAQAPPEEGLGVSFKGRHINIERHFGGFPYSSHLPALEHGLWFYLRRDELMEAPIGPHGVDLAAGRRLGGTDFSKRRMQHALYRAADSRLYWVGDENGSEVYNVYSLQRESGVITKITRSAAAGAWSWGVSPDESKAAYVIRVGSGAAISHELHVLDFDTHADHVLARDTAGMRFAPFGSPIVWQPDGSGVVLTGWAEGDRRRANLLYLSLAEARTGIRVLTDASVPRETFPISPWISGRSFAFLSNEAGRRSVYRYDLPEHRSVRLTRTDADLWYTARVIEDHGRKYVVALTDRPLQNELLLVDVGTGEAVHALRGRFNYIMDGARQRLAVWARSVDGVMEIKEVEVSDGKLSVSRNLVSWPAHLKQDLLHCDASQVQYPTFDKDPATNAPRMLHAFVYHPRRPLDARDRLALVQAFYGGSDGYSRHIQMLCEAGITVMSPAPRGSDGFGREFAALNDGDMGGAEVLDVIYAAKFLSKRERIPSKRIGAFGSSHGGYAVMRLLTFPGEVNGVRASFDWGFGISHAGISSLVTAAEETKSIADWFALEAGHPERDRDKLLDRSPITSAERLHAPLLLTHGTNDTRIPVAESRRMAQRLQKLGKPVTLVEFEGEGHALNSAKAVTKQLRAWFEFLEQVP